MCLFEWLILFSFVDESLCCHLIELIKGLQKSLLILGLFPLSFEIITFIIWSLPEKISLNGLILNSFYQSKKV